MIVKFDSLDRFEVPKFYVCNPGSVVKDGTITNVLGCLSDTSDEELVMNFNATSELSFRLNRIIRENSEENAYSAKLYRAIQNRRMIFVEDIGYFVVTSVDDGYDDGVYYKDVRAESCEVELQNKMLPFIEDGTYKFTDLLEMIVSSMPYWLIGSVNGDVALKYRTFTDVPDDTNVLAFLLDNMQDAYECIFMFDTVHRIINVYDQNNFISETQIHITKEDVINSIVISEGSEDLYTAINVHGDENLNISPVNPLGTNILYNFDYYLDWMTPELKAKVVSWQELVKSKEDEYYSLNLQYFEKMTGQSNTSSEIARLEIQLDMYQRCKDNIIADGSTATVESYNEVIKKNGGVPIGIQDDLSETVKEINAKIAEVKSSLEEQKNDIVTEQEQISSLVTSINAIHDIVSIGSYFTPDEYAELSNYIYEGSYTDEYIAVTQSMTYSQRFEQMKTLYDRSVERLKRVSAPTQEFSIDTENFIFSKRFEEWSDQLQTGSLVNVELDQDDIALLFLATITVNYDDKSLKLKFGNRFNRFDQKALFDGFIGNIKKSANSINYVKEILYPIKNGEFDSMKEAIDQSGVLTKDLIMSARNQDFLIDDTGILGRKSLGNGEFDRHQVKMTNQGVVFTENGWESANTALGKFIYVNPQTGETEEHYGIIANTLIGNMILSQQAGIYNEKNSITLDKDGFILTSDFTRDEPVKNVFIIQKKMADENGTEYYVKQLYLDTNGQLILNGGIGVYTGSGNVSGLEDFTQQIANDAASEIPSQIMPNITEKINGISSSITEAYEQSIDAINDRINNYEAEVGQFMTYGENGLTLGAAGSEFKAVIDNKNLAFYSGDAAVSWISGKQLYIPNAVIETTLTLGKFFFSPRDDGGFSLTWQG